MPDASSSHGDRPDDIDHDQRRRDLEALKAFVDAAGVPQDASDIDTAQQAREGMERLDTVLDRLRAIAERAVSPRKGFAFVLVSDAIAYVTDVRSGYLRRFAALQQQEQMTAIEEAVAQKVADPDARRELSDLLAAIRRQQQEPAWGVRTGEDLEVGELARLNIIRRRWEVRKAMLEREPAAVLVGGLLLLGIAGALVVAMFTHTTVPEILSSGFLLILGFFFGQNSTRGGPPGSSS